MNDILEVDHLEKKYRHFTLKDITFHLPRGQIMGLIGPNGAGKTTIIKLIMNIIRTRTGRIRIFGLTHSENEKEIKNRIGYVGEEPLYYGDKTVAWTERYLSSFYSRWDTNGFQMRLNDFAISRTKRIQELSKGQKVKLSLAVALAHQPELAILDEPTAGLDPIVRREVLEILRNFVADENKSVLISSHITDDIVRTADSVAFLIKGRLVLAERLDDLISRWKTVHLEKSSPSPAILSRLHNVTEHMFSITGITDRYPVLASELSSEFSRSGVRIENASLDEILITLARGESR